MAGRARTTSAPASTGSAIAAASSTDQPFDIQYRDNNSALGAGRHLQLAGDRHQRRRLHRRAGSTTRGRSTNRLTLNLGVRVENYKDQWPDQSLTPNGIPALAGWTDPRIPVVRRAAGRAGDDRGQHHDAGAEGRLRLRPDAATTARCSRASSASRAGTRPTRWPTRRTRSASRSCATPSCRARRARPPAATSTAIVSSARRQNSARSSHTQGGGGFVRVDRDLDPSEEQRDLGEPRARDHDRPVGPRVVGLQEHAQRVGRNRRRARGRLHRAVHDSAIRASTASSARPTTRRSRRWRSPPASAPIASSPTSATGNADFHTMEFALNRRFSGKWMMLDVVRLHLVDDGAHRRRARPARCVVYRPFDRSVGRRRQRDRRRCGTTRSSAATCCRTTSASRDRGRCRAASTTPAPSA